MSERRRTAPHPDPKIHQRERAESVLPSRPPPGPRSLGPRPSQIVCNGLEELAALDHYVFRLDRRCRLLVVRRTTTPFADTLQIRTCFNQIQRLLAALPRQSYLLLMDARSGPSRNDPAFERVMREERGKLLLGFSKNAALAATAAGRLQIQRFARQDGRVVVATDSPSEAFEYLGVPPHPV